MFNDTITVHNPDATAVVFARRTQRGNRAVFVPSGDTPANERKLEIAHESTAAKRVSTLVKFALVRPNPTSPSGVLEEGSIQVKIVRPASFTEAECVKLQCYVTEFLSDTATMPKLFNQEQ